MTMVITSPQNPRIKTLVALRRGRERAAAGVMLVEGYEELAVALAGGVHPRELYYCPELMAPGQVKLLDDERLAGTQLVKLSREAFERAAYREGPDGWLAVMPTVVQQLDQLRLSKQPLVLVAEAVEKPGNLGAMLRTADAVGAEALIGVDTGTDWGNPNIVRASKGTIFTVPVVEATRPQFLAWLKTQKLRLLAATPEATAVYTDVDMTTGLAIAVGTEKEGLTAELMMAADERVVIPMAGKVNSLNVATSAALLLYEARRQRGV